jgi:hypothetical protein
MSIFKKNERYIGFACEDIPGTLNVKCYSIFKNKKEEILIYQSSISFCNNEDKDDFLSRNYQINFSQFENTDSKNATLCRKNFHDPIFNWA